MTDRAPQPFELAVFDVAGTTVFDGDAVLECLRDALRAHVSASLQDVREVMGLPKPVAIRHVLRMHRDGDASPDVIEAVHDDFRTALLTRYRDDRAIAPVPGAAEVFDALRSAGVTVALDTGFSRDILDALLTRLGWTNGVAINFSVTSDEVPRGRPYPDLIYRAMQLAGVRAPCNVIKVGDTPVDLLEGLAAKCGLVVGVTYGTHSRAELERPNVVTIDSLSALLPLAGLGAA